MLMSPICLCANSLSNCLTKCWCDKHQSFQVPLEWKTIYLVIPWLKKVEAAASASSTWKNKTCLSNRWNTKSSCTSIPFFAFAALISAKCYDLILRKSFLVTFHHPPLAIFSPHWCTLWNCAVKACWMRQFCSGTSPGRTVDYANAWVCTAVHCAAPELLMETQ